MSTIESMAADEEQQDESKPLGDPPDNVITTEDGEPITTPDGTEYVTED